MLFHQGDSINSEYKQRFKEQIEVPKAYNGGVLFVNSPRATAREIKLLVLDEENADGMEKAQTSVRGKYLATAFLLSSDSRWYRELILSLKNDYVRQQRNYPKTLTDMYRLMVAFETTRVTPVDSERNKGLNFGNVVADSKDIGIGYTGGGGGAGRKLECWNCGGEHLKRNCLKHAEDKSERENAKRRGRQVVYPASQR